MDLLENFKCKFALTADLRGTLCWKLRHFAICIDVLCVPYNPGFATNYGLCELFRLQQGQQRWPKMHGWMILLQVTPNRKGQPRILAIGYRMTQELLSRIGWLECQGTGEVRSWEQEGGRDVALAVGL